MKKESVCKDNKIDDEGALTLFEMLEVNTSLISLVLFGKRSEKKKDFERLRSLLIKCEKETRSEKRSERG